MAMQQTLNASEVKQLVGKKRAAGKSSAGRYGKRHIPGQMNKTEEAYADILEAKKLVGDILEWIFEPGSLRYAKDARYTADFLVMHSDSSLEYIDVKGGGPINEASTCRAKACAERFWMFTFSQIEKQPKNKGGHWVRTEF